ncbi:MAG: FKBP-type peptidyl-prolyl cis-trans isomerase [Dehalococcoidia bacterium]|nr:FKBP-type peptidyl-prolyl cis-trans isomerase [Dehalococcoidia bacterium]
MWVAAGGVVGAIAIALVLIVTLGGGGDGNVVANQPSGSPSAEGSPTVTPEGQTPAPGAPANPPAVSGEEKTTDTGLRYIDVQEGTGVTPKPGQTVVVNYSGWLESTGAKFDSSLDRGQPFSFVLGVGQVIDGWDQGLGTMKVGGQRRLIVPPALGYGERGAGTTIPPNSTLIFDVELLDVTASASPGQ